MDGFVPDDNGIKEELPLYKDVMGRSVEGWQGHTTKMTLDQLREKIGIALSRLGGTLASMKTGEIPHGDYIRPVAIIYYALDPGDNIVLPGKIEIAGLPVDPAREQTFKKQKDQSLRMALYMVHVFLQGAWNMQVLSPGSFPLMSWMLNEETGKTFASEYMIRFGVESNRFLIAPISDEHDDDEFVDGEFEETDG